MYSITEIDYLGSINITGDVSKGRSRYGTVPWRGAPPGRSSEPGYGRRNIEVAGTPASDVALVALSSMLAESRALSKHFPPDTF